MAVYTYLASPIAGFAGIFLRAKAATAFSVS